MESRHSFNLVGEVRGEMLEVPSWVGEISHNFFQTSSSIPIQSNPIATMTTETSPMHSPISSSANAPKPKGILKNSNERSRSFSQAPEDSSQPSSQPATAGSSHSTDPATLEGRTHNAEENR